MTLKNGLKLLTAISIVSSLAGCDSSVSDELENALTHEAEMSFINTLDYSVDFHVQKRTLTAGSSGLFDSKNLAAGNVLSNTATDDFDYDYPAITNAVNIGIHSTNGAENEIKIHTNLSNDDELWVIAWQNGNEKRLTLLDSIEKDNDSTFNVRIFANGIYPVTIKGNQVMTTQMGTVSDFLTLDNCASDLRVNNHTINLCSGDFGESYLLVVDQNGEYVLVEE